MNLSVWKMAKINDAQIEYCDQGKGEAVVFVHGGMGAECAAVLKEPALLDDFRVIHYHRRGYGNSTSPKAPVSFSQQSSDCFAVLRHLGVQRAHFAGQSYGGAIVLQLAIDNPALVYSVALLEPALASVLMQSADFGNAVAEALGHYQTGDKRTAMDVFARAVVGSEVDAEVDRKFRAEYFDRWVPDADVLYRSDLPALQEWSFTAEDASKIKQPVLNVRGSHTPPVFREIHEAVQNWLPHAQNVIVPGSSHPLLQMDPRGMAERLAAFFREHPITAHRSTRRSAAKV